MPTEQTAAEEVPVGARLAGRYGLQRFWGPRLQPHADPWVERDPHGPGGAAPSTGQA